MPPELTADTDRPCDHCGCLFTATNHEALMGNLYAVVRQRDRLKAALRAAGVHAETVGAIALNDGTGAENPTTTVADTVVSETPHIDGGRRRLLTLEELAESAGLGDALTDGEACR